MEAEDSLYYRTRLSEERRRALSAETSEASAAHRGLAELYRQRLDERDAAPARSRAARGQI